MGEPLEYLSQVGIQKRRSSVMGKGKVHKVMSEYKDRTLKSSSGKKVTKRKQAIAIAMSEAGLSKKRRK
jgi:hypothetical protein